MAVVEPVRRKGGRGKRRRIVLGVVAALVLLVVLAPTLVGLVGRGVVESRLARALGSGVRIERLGLSWWGNQRVRSLRVVDGSLREVADVDIRLERSLLGLIVSPKDLGTVVVSGYMELDEREGPLSDILKDDGTATDAGGEPGLPAGLRVAVRAEGLTVVYRDREGEELRAEGIEGIARVAAGGAASVDVRAGVSRGDMTARVEVAAEATGLTSDSGAFTMESAVVQGKVSLAGERSPVGAVVGEGFAGGAFTSEATFSGGWDRGEASVVFESPEAAASLPVAYRREGGSVRVTAAGEGRVRADASVVERLFPGMGELAGRAVRLESGQVVEIAALPGVSAVLSELSVDVPTDGGELDLGAVVLRGRLEAGELRGTLDGEAWEIEPMSVDVTTRGVRRGVSVQAVTTARLGGRPAGVFVVNAEAENLFVGAGEATADGLVERLLTGLRGGVEINDVEGALIDSLAGGWLRGAGVSVAQDLGGRVDAELAFEGGQERRLRAAVSSENVRGSAGFVLNGTEIRGDGAGVRLEADSIAPLVTRQLGIEGVRLTEGGRAELWVRDVVVDLDRLRAEGEEGADLRGVSGQVELRVEPMRGEVVVEGATRRLETLASAVTVDVLDIAQGASVAAGLSLRVDEKPAGEFGVSLRATEVVDGRGRLRGGLPTLEGELTARQVMTALAQGLVSETGLVLAEDVGPTLDVVARATVNAEGVVGVQLGAEAQCLTGEGELEIQDRSLRGAGEGVAIQITGVGPTLRRLAPEGWTLGDGGTLSVRSETIALAMSDTGIDWSRTELAGRVTLGDLRVSDAAGESLHAERVDVAARLDGASGEGSVELSGVATVSGEPMPLGGRLTATGLVGAGGWTPGAMRLDGRLDVGQVPIAPARRAADAAATPVRDLAAELFGRVLDFSVVAEGASGSVVVAVTGERLTGEVRTELLGGDLRVTGGEIVSEIGTEVMEQMRLRAGQQAGVAGPVGARFVEPARVELSFEGFGVLRDFGLALSGTPGVRLSASGMVEGLPLMPNGEAVSSGAIGLEELVIEGRVPVGALGGSDAGATALSLAVSGELTTRGASIGTLTGGVDIDLVGGRPSGEVRGDLRLAGLDTGLVDDVALLDGLLAGALGAKLDAEVAFEGRAASGKVAELGAELTVNSPRMRTREAVRFVVEPEEIRLREEAWVDWRVAPEVATRYGLSQPVGAERVRVTEDVELAAHVERLTLSRGAGPIREGVFGVSASVEAPRVRVVVPSEVSGAEAAAEHVYEPVRVVVKGDSGRISVEGSAQDAAGGRAPVTLSAELTEFAGEGGELMTETARVDGELRVTQAPSAMLDGLLSLNGLMAEALGPEASLTVTGDDVGLHAGSLTAEMESTRASGRLVATMFEGRLIAVEPAVVTLRELRPELGTFITEAMPVVGTVTKRPEDGPALLTVNTLEIPLVRSTELGRVERLVAEAVIDFGTARFETSSIFSSIMKATGQRSEGGLGRRMSPIAVTINSGVLTYPRTAIPVGEFTIESSGEIRLTDGYIDVVTFVPMAALTEEALGSLKTGVLSAIGRQLPFFEEVTMVPWRMRGMPGDRKLRLDVEMLLQNTRDTLNPLDLLNRGLGALTGRPGRTDETGE